MRNVLRAVPMAIAFALLGCGSSSSGSDGSSTSTGGAGGTSGHPGGAGGSAASTCEGCPGCCAGTTCVPFSEQDKTTCGTSGATCSACSAGLTCDSGACVTDATVCSPLTCANGCCHENMCIPANVQDWNACGSDGATCGTCGTGLACSGGACDSAHYASDAKFLLQAISIANCSCTDAVGAPDPYVVLTDGAQTGMTNVCQDMVGCNFASGSIQVTGADLAAGKVSFTILDQDETSDDTCGGGLIQFTGPIPTKGPFTVTDASNEMFVFSLTPMP